MWRSISAFNVDNVLRFGTVERRYLGGSHPEIYEVRWDGRQGRQEVRRYLPHGIDMAPRVGHVRQALDLTAGLFRYRQRQARLVIHPIAHAIVERLESTHVDSEASNVRL